MTNQSHRWLRALWYRRRYFVEDEAIKPVQNSKVDLYDPFGSHRAEAEALRAEGLEPPSPLDSEGWERAADLARQRAEARWKADPAKRGTVLTRAAGDGYDQVPLSDYFGRFFPDLLAGASSSDHEG